jgi:hypothetical protein
VDLVWPALVVSGYLLSAPVILVGLGIEIACLRLLLAMPWRRALVAGVAMNLVSCLLGVILIPLAGVLWEVFPGLVLYDVFHIGTFNPGTWTATFFMAVAINALLEASTLRFAFGVPFSRRTFGILAVANCASVSVAFVSLWLYPSPY